MDHVSIEIIRKCPNNCLHCSSRSNISCTEIMDIDLVKKIFDGLYNIGTDVISISGGEPFLHKDLVDIVRYGKEKGFKINIYTSGIMLDDKGNRISIKEELIETLSKFGVDKLIFNVQSLNEDVYNEIMGTKGNMPLLKSSILNTKKNGIYTELHFVPMKLNYKDIIKIIQFVNDNNLDRVSFLGLIPHGRAKDNMSKLYLDRLHNQEVKALLAQEECEKVRVGIPLKLENTSCHCNAGKNKLYIKFDGKVYGCEAFKYIQIKDEKNVDIEPDTVYERAIEDIFSNSRYLKAANEKIAVILNNGKLKENCPIQEELRKREE